MAAPPGSEPPALSQPPASYEHPRLLLIDDSRDEPAYWTLFIAYHLACGETVRRNDDTLMNTCPVGINGNLRRTFRIASRADRLADEQAPPFQARVLASRHDVAFNTS